MKSLLLPYFFLFSNFLMAQNIDSSRVAAEVDSLLLLSRAWTAQREFVKALKANADAEILSFKKFGRESAQYGSCCFNHGRILHIKGEYLEAEKWYLEAKAIRENVLGKEHPDYATSLNKLANLHSYLGLYEKAEPLYLEAKVILEKNLEKEQPLYAANLNDLANLYIRMGDYEKAEPLHLEAWVIREKILGREHTEYAQSLNNLAGLYTYMAQYEKAEPFYIEAKAIIEKTYGRQHPNFAINLQNLAGLYMRMGQYEKAEPLHLEAKAIREITIGKAHPDYAWSLNNLANLYVNIGQYEKAEPLYLEAKVIWEKALGREHPDYASCLNNMARMYISMGQYEKAEPLHLEARTIRKKTLGKEHPNYAWSLNNLANLYTYMGQHEKAESFYNEAKYIRGKKLGKEHPDYAASLNNLGHLYMIMGQYEKAEPLLLEAMTIWEKTLGKEHNFYTETIGLLAKLYHSLGEFRKAEPLYEELATVNQSLLQKALQYLSERELHSYINKFSESQNLTLSFAQMSGSKKVIPICYENSLFYKGLLLNSVGQINRLAQMDSISTAILTSLKGYRRRLATLYTLPIAERKNAEELEEKANTLEKELRRSLPDFDKALTQVTWQDVRNNLKPNEAAIEFVRFRYYNPDPTDTVIYAALVLRPGDEAPHFVRLCTEVQLKTVLDRWDEKNVEISPAEVYWPKEGEASVYDLLWQPLETLVPQGTTVWYAPAGLLHRLNLGAVSLNNNQPLANNYSLHRIGSTRQIAIKELAPILGKEAALFGGLRYDTDTLAMQRALEELPFVSSTFSELDERKPQAPDSYKGPKRDKVIYLENSLTEVQNISKNLKTAGFSAKTFIGYKGLEEAVLQTGGNPKKLSPRILHVATHGYFFPDPKEDSTAMKNPMGMERHIPYRASDNPFIRSGLLLSGSEHAWRTGTPASAKLADGILTAADIAAMDLSNTELAVLSACETGLGDIETNEGVYGLQRAFKIAGVRYLIMSLWKVDDHLTMQLMTSFYAKWLDKENPVSIPEAFRAAQRELQKSFPDPYFWAGFVLVE